MSNRRTNSMRHTTEQFIERSKSKYGDKFSYTKTNYINAHTNITIYCNLCNIEFETSPNRHLRSIDGCCLNCLRIKIGNNKRKPISKFITQSKDIFGELKYDYSLVDYKNKHTKIKLKCIECDYIFEQTPHTHLSGNNGCSICGKGKLNTESFITKSKKIHINNEYDYSKVIYVNANKKIIIQCNRCGNDFKQTPGCHLSGRGCKECSIKTRSINRTSNKEDFVEKANKIFTQNEYDYTNSIYIKSDTNIDIYCNKCNKIFILTPNKHLGGRGCTSEKCKYEKLKVNFIKKATEIFGIDKYDYSLIDYKNYKQLKIRCIKCDYIFEQDSGAHLLGQNGCALCGITVKYDTDTFIRKCKLIHGGKKFNFDNTIYTGSNDNVKIYCNLCKIEFTIIASKILMGRGCQKCGYKIMSNKATYSTEDFISKSKEVYGDNAYDYSNVNYINSRTKIKLKCNRCNNKYEQEPRIHLTTSCCNSIDKYKCPKCFLWRTGGKLCSYCIPQTENKKYQKTKEYKIVEFLRENIDINFIHNKSVGKECTIDDRENTNGHLYPDIRFDCLTFNLIVEIDEFQHRGSNYNCDERRMYDIIAKLGMPCVFIRYNPDNKDSNKNNLLKEINKYLEYNYEEIDFDDYGLNVIYMYYD